MIEFGSTVLGYTAMAWPWLQATAYAAQDVAFAVVRHPEVAFYWAQAFIYAALAEQTKCDSHEKLGNHYWISSVLHFLFGLSHSVR